MDAKAHPIITALLLWLLAACSEGNQSVTEEIWSAYVNSPGNQNLEYYDLSGEIVSQGTVPASAVGSLANGSLPAYIARYNYVENMKIGGFQQETPMTMYMYYIQNPERGKNHIAWGSKEKINRQALDGGYQGND